MENLIIDYTFNKNKIANRDGSSSANFSGTTVTEGPGNTTLGKFPKALDFGTKGKAKVDLTGINPDLNQFCFQFVFRVKGSINARQNLFESTLLPFSIFVLPGENLSEFELKSTIKTINQDWNGPDTQFKKTLKPDKWYVVTVAYDFDTLALFIDDQIVSVHAFPNGDIKKGNKNQLFIGTWTDGNRNQFQGCLAAFKWYNDVPQNIESRLDEQRNQAEWFISYKYESFSKNFSTGSKTKGIEFDRTTGMHIQYYDTCAIMYHDSLGTAFEMHGAILSKYKSMRNRSSLGYLVSDESSTTKAGGRKNIFNKGGIYWSPSTGAISVLNNIYLDYEYLGESAALGFPIKEAKKIHGGQEQTFEGCRMYYRNGTSNAHEVHGAILQKFISSGGVNKWGYPVTNEMNIKNGRAVKGKFSEFEQCTIYWSRQTGAFEMHGDIRKKYVDAGGPLSELGFPTSDEKDIPSVAGHGRINTFQKGSILWYGSYNSVVIARPFKIWIGRIDSRESEGWGMGQNDLYFQYIRIKEGNRYLFNKRYPHSGDWGGNIKNVKYTIPVTVIPNTISKSIQFLVSIQDADPGNDDHLGSYSKTLSAANAWGLRDNGGIYNESFSKIKSFTWSIKPQINVDTLSEIEKWWGVDNEKTDDLTWRQCASAFRDIDSDTEWWDVTDWLEKSFYELVVKDVAESGNCFGMSLEGIYARKGSSLFSLPINRFHSWNNLKNEFNIKHSYQVGAGPIWWFLGEFLTGNTHDPKDVFNRTRSEFNKGNHPVVCIAQNYNFSGAPHCILPIPPWDSSSKPWEMTICDPNFPGELRRLTVDPDNNSFEYKGKEHTYNGTAWSGGRFHYMPFSLLNKPPRTPVWDAILLLLSGTILILGDDAETTKITDANGNDLHAFGDRAKKQMQSGRKPEEFFVGFQGFERSQNIQPDQILIRSENIFSQVQDPGVITGATLPVSTVMKDRRFAKLSTLLKGKNKLKNLMAGRTANHLLNDPNIKSAMSDKLAKGIAGIANINASRNYVHHIKGKKNGQLNYVVKHGLSELKIETSLNANETHKINVNDLGTNSNVLKMASDRNKTSTITIRNKLGVSGDFIQMELDKVPLTKNNPLALNIKQGITGLEMMNTGAATNFPITIDAKIAGKGVRKTFNVRLEKGMRLKPASILSHQTLTISKIDRIFGPVISTMRLKN